MAFWVFSFAVINIRPRILPGLLLEEIRYSYSVLVKSKKISSYPGRDLLKGVLKLRNALVKVEWVEREEELSIICLKVVVKGKGRDQNTEKGDVHDQE